MKKSQLRNIIRESIKGLMTEQQSPNTRSVAFNWCDDSGNDFAYTGYDVNNQLFNSYCMTVNGGQVPQIGQTIEAGDPPNWPWPGVVPNGNPFGRSLKITLVSPASGNGPVPGQPGACSNGWNQAYNSYDIPLALGSGCPVYGCTDSNAYNHDPNATQDDGSCDYGFYCKDTWPEKPGIMKKCTPGNQNNPGQFSTKADCLASGCEPLRADDDIKSITPFTTDPQSKMTDPTIDRMQQLAKITK